MNKKYILILMLNLLILVSSTTLAKYVFKDTLDVAEIITEGNYYLITYTEVNDANKKEEKLDKGENHDEDGKILKKWIQDTGETLETIKIKDKSGDIKNCSFLFSAGVDNTTKFQNLTKVDLSEFNTTNVTDMFCMFSECVNLVDINLSEVKTDNVYDMTCMFYNCASLEVLDLTSFNTYLVGSMDAMFAKCESLKEIKVSKWWKVPSKRSNHMFNDCNISEVTIYD